MYVPDRGIRPELAVVAQASGPARHGQFDMHVFRWVDPDVNPCQHGLSPDHVALTMGNLDGAEGALVRVHSECLTSEVFGSLKCDCRQQLESALSTIAAVGCGAVLYLRQEGRGIGRANKIRAYELQSTGHDTVDANRLLGLPDDAREYSAAAAMIAHLGISSVQLITNNPDKVSKLAALGVDVGDRLPSLVPTNPHSALYLETKRQRMGHHLPELEAAADAE